MALYSYLQFDANPKTNHFNISCRGAKARRVPLDLGKRNDSVPPLFFLHILLTISSRIKVGQRASYTSQFNKMDRQSIYSVSVFNAGPNDDTRIQLQEQLVNFVLTFRLDNKFVYR